MVTQTGGDKVRIDLLARKIFKFDTQHEMAAFVSRIDADDQLKKALESNFYHGSLEYNQVFYRIILHELDLSDRHQEAIMRYAEESGGINEKNKETRKILSIYALNRHLRAPSSGMRWDSALPKTH